MFCDKCGKEIPDSANFCRYCGSTVEANEIISESESTGDIKEPKVSEQTEVSESAASAEANVCDEDTSDKADSEEDVDEDKTANSEDELSAEFQGWQKKFLAKLALVGIAVIIVIVIGTVIIGRVSFTSQFKGTWSLMSGNYTCEYEENISRMPSYIEISGWGNKVTVDGYSGEYDLDENSETITFITGTYNYCYNYIVEDDILYLLGYGSEEGTGDVGIYLNYADASDEHKEYYDYAVNTYSDIDLYEFLEGDWNAVNDGYEHFKMYDGDDSRTWISYSLAVPENDGDHYEIDGNLIKVDGGELNAFRVIPISNDAAYFFCYADSSMYELKRDNNTL
mgnify:CR=1 FL=1